MTNIYRKIRPDALEVGDEVVAHTGRGWVFGRIEAVNPEAQEIQVLPSTAPMIDPGRARRDVARLVAPILASQDVEIEDLEVDELEWPSLDRIERRKLDYIDPLHRAISQRLGRGWRNGDIWIETHFSTGGYSECTMEQEYGLRVIVGNKVYSFGDSESEVPLEELLRWLDGEDWIATQLEEGEL